MADPVSLPDYWDMLSRADWYYDYSDDHTVWRAGRAELIKLEGIAHQSLDHKALYQAWVNHMFTGEAWNTARAPRPERPTE